MRPAPPLVVDFAPGAMWSAACVALGVTAGLAVAAGVAGHFEWRLGIAAAVCAFSAAACGGFALGAAGPRRRVQVRWDGRRWWVDEVPGRVQPMLDLQDWMLLRLSPEGGGKPRWLGVGAQQVIRVGRAASEAASASGSGALSGAPNSRSPVGGAGPAAWAGFRTALYSPAPIEGTAVEPAPPAPRP